MRRIRTVAVLPTMFTLANLVCGFFAIVVASRIAAPSAPMEIPRAAEIHFRDSPFAFVTQLVRTDDVHNAMLAGWLIFLAMIFDALDGHVARLAKVSSDFGAQLDSLCDLVTFGVAPAILLVKMCPIFTYAQREAIWVIAASFAACVALRLARFNVESGEDDDHMRFNGLPSPAGAAAIASFAILFYTLRRESSSTQVTIEIDRWLQLSLPFYAVIVAALMVSRIPYPHIVNQAFRGQKSFGHVVGLVFAIAAVMLFRGISVPILCAVFTLGPPLRFAYTSLKERKSRKESLF
jgi:CDP-diacylglycerol---serine O-phosphatidyltransferase